MGISSLNSLQLNLLLAGIILLHVGAFMVKLFWFPRPKGTAPFCKRCSYNLQGLQSEQCPECGIYLTSNNIIRGQRLRRPRLTVLALCILLLGLLAAWLGLSERFRNIDWYTYKPTSWVISDLKSPDAELCSRAWDEINERLEEKKLSTDQLAKLHSAMVIALNHKNFSAIQNELIAMLVENFSQLAPEQRQFVFDRLLKSSSSSDGRRATDALAQILKFNQAGLLTKPQQYQLLELALKAQAAPSNYTAAQELAEFLGVQAEANRLSPEQRESFFNRALPPVLHIGQSTTQGDNLPYEVSIDGFGPFKGWCWACKIRAMIDNETIASSEREEGAGGLNGGGIHGKVYTGYVDPGKHHLKVQLILSAYPSEEPPALDETTKPAWEKTFHLSAPFELLPKGTAKPSGR